MTSAQSTMIGPAAREFESPSGRRWTASLLYVPAPPPASPGSYPALASTSVLRFRSEDLSLDLTDWPDDWFLLPQDELLRLLRRATIPAFVPPSTPDYALRAITLPGSARHAINP